MNCTHGWEDAEGMPAPCYDCVVRELAETRAVIDFIANRCIRSHSPNMDGTSGFRFDSYYLHRVGRTTRTPEEALKAARAIYEQDCKQAAAAGEER